MARLSDIIGDVHQDKKVRLAKKIRKLIWYDFIIGITLALMIVAVSFWLWRDELQRVGGSMVGTSVMLQIFTHWLGLYPDRDKFLNWESRVTVISGMIALIGTILWTFGDNI